MREQHKQITPLETLLHPFFDEIKKEHYKLNNGQTLLLLKYNTIF